MIPVMAGDEPLPGSKRDLPLYCFEFGYDNSKIPNSDRETCEERKEEEKKLLKGGIS
jgi:hypothetical protein